MKKYINSLLMLAALLAALIPTAQQTVHAQDEILTVTIQPNGSQMKDTQIINGVGGNFGSEVGFVVGEKNNDAIQSRALLQFDLSGFPANFEVVSATLTLTVIDDFSSNGRIMYAYGLNVPWAEDATWSETGGGFATWPVPGAAGNSASVNAIGQVTVADNLTAGSTVTMTLDNAAVENMGLRDNYLGFKLQMDVEDNDAYHFASSDNSNEAYRPKLVLEYKNEKTAIDDTWQCTEKTNWVTLDCLPSPMTPFTFSKAAAPKETHPMAAAKLLCEPYPRCVNDYPIYYRIEYKVKSFSPNNYIIWMMINNAASGTELLNKECILLCEGFVEGMIQTTDLTAVITDLNAMETNVFFYQQKYSNGQQQAANIEWSVFISRKPFTENCASTYAVPLPETFEIDPLLETPLGVNAVAPAEPDNQIYATVIDQLYMVRVLDGPWNDGTNPRTDAAVSFDGVTWITWADLELLAVCVDADPYHPSDNNYRSIYFVATTETFHIRVNDEEGMFGDNTNNGDAPYSYMIGVASLLALECGDQFTYDESADWVASVSVHSEYDDVLATEDLQAGEWYGIEVVSGTWTEPGHDPSKAMEYYFGTAGNLDLWENLKDGSSAVQCAISTTAKEITFIQAGDTSLHLRADDQDGNFTNNDGTLNVNIYHTSFNRPSDVCELNFAIDQLVRTDSVEAKAENGKIFALVVGSALVNSNDQPENFLSGGLVPGAWYALETYGGPWGYYSDSPLGTPKMSYTMAIAVESIDPTGVTENWTPLSAWEGSECNIEIDKLGHRMVYFQMPVTGALQYKLRVNDTAQWTNNTGLMSWNLYRMTDLGPPSTGLCDYSYDPAAALNQTVQTVRADAVNGALIQTGLGAGEAGPSPLLLPDSYYAVEILGADYKWYEQDGSEPQTAMQLSLNNGSTWGPVVDNALCIKVDGENTIFYLHTGTDVPKFKLRVDSTSFSDNTGFMGYNVYLAEPGTSIVSDGCVTDGYSITALGPYEWIPVDTADGIGLASTSASYAEISGLVPDNHYIVETSRGGWFDGETNQEHYSAQVSSDGGLTWKTMDGNNDDVTCWEYTPDYKYYKIEFTVKAGQDWRIRVADTDTAQFEDNTGKLAFTLQGVVIPQDTTVTGEFTLAGCNTPPVFPGLLEVNEVLNLGNYLAEWIDYSIGSFVSFFALCPDNIADVTTFADDIIKKEPFASIKQLNGVLNDIKNEMNSYDWGTEGTDYSILTKSPAQASAMMAKYIFGPISDDSPWLGNDLVNFDDAPSATMYEDNCNLSLNEYIGPLLGRGVCFASNWAREIGFTFYMQLILDVGLIFAAFRSVLNSINKAIFLFTGVNLHISSNDTKVFVQTITGDERGGRR